MSYRFYFTIKSIKSKCKDLHCRKNSSYIYESEYYRDLEGGLFYLETVNNHPQYCGNHLLTLYTVKYLCIVLQKKNANKLQQKLVN